MGLMSSISDNGNTLVEHRERAVVDKVAHKQQTTASCTAHQIKIVIVIFTEICKYMSWQLSSHEIKHDLGTYCRRTFYFCKFKL